MSHSDLVKTDTPSSSVGLDSTEHAAADSQHPDIRHWPLLVTLRKKTISRGLWEVDSWSLHSCGSDRDIHQRQSLSWRESAAIDDAGAACQDYQWSGLSLELFRDERTAYRFNLSAVDPRLFVICNEEDELMQPYLVTASQDEASSYMDGGEEDVYSVAMPTAIQCWIEGFIARHGEPEMDVGKSKRRHHGRRKPKADTADRGNAHG